MGLDALVKRDGTRWAWVCGLSILLGVWAYSGRGQSRTRHMGLGRTGQGQAVWLNDFDWDKFIGLVTLALLWYMSVAFGQM